MHTHTLSLSRVASEVGAPTNWVFLQNKQINGRRIKTTQDDHEWSPVTVVTRHWWEGGLHPTHCCQVGTPYLHVCIKVCLTHFSLNMSYDLKSTIISVISILSSSPRSDWGHGSFCQSLKLFFNLSQIISTFLPWNLILITHVKVNIMNDPLFFPGPLDSSSNPLRVMTHWLETAASK